VRIALITDKPDHPVLAEVVDGLRARQHRVGVLPVGTAEDPAGRAAQEARALADVYLLKSHTTGALELARRLELCGALVVNRWAATLACQDRVLMSHRVAEAGLPGPRTWSVPTLGRARPLVGGLPLPLIVKSRLSRRGDLVTRVDSSEQLEALMPRWGGEPVILQEYAENDGWDVKVWVVAGRVFAARRRTPLHPDAGRETFPLADGELPGGWVAAVLRAGRAFDLTLYGVDLLLTAGGPVIVDVNAFPGYRGVPGAAAAIVAFTEGLSMEASATA
jgi:ribosomal protein S6--L-glutamate ligase